MLETSRAQTAFDAKNELIRETWHNMENMTLNEEQEEVGLKNVIITLFLLYFLVCHDQDGDREGIHIKTL